MKQLDEYNICNDPGKNRIHPSRYKRMKVYIIDDIKYDTRHKATYVADGHLTEVLLSSVYFGVVSLHGLRMMILLFELNQLYIWSTDIGN